MKGTVKDDMLTLFTEDHIDTSNADQPERKAFGTIEEAGVTSLMTDAAKLGRISRSRLRISMRLMKHAVPLDF